MRYAINENGGVVFRSGDTPFPHGAVWPIPGELATMDLSWLRISGGQLVQKTADEIRIQHLPLKYRLDGGLDTEGNQLWFEKSQEDKDAADAQEATSVDDAEYAWQQAKSPALKRIENIYVDFLANMWSPALRTAGLIAEMDAITVENTDESTNLYFLMQMRQIDYSIYDRMASEFTRLKMAIVSNGGVMAKVIQHTV